MDALLSPTVIPNNFNNHGTILSINASTAFIRKLVKETASFSTKSVNLVPNRSAFTVDMTDKTTSMITTNLYNVSQNVTELSDNYFVWITLGAVVLGILTLWTIVGNVMVWVALYRYRELRTMSNMLIGNLAFSDFLLGCTVLPISAAHDLLGYWSLGRIMCVIWLCIDVLYCTASIWGLCTIAVDRYTATVYPMWYHEQRSPKRAMVYILFVWVFSAVVSFAPFIGWSETIPDLYTFNNGTGQYDCLLFTSKGYVFYSASGSFIIPLVLMMFLYIRIFIALHKRSKVMRKRTKNRVERASQRYCRKLIAPDKDSTDLVTVKDSVMSSHTSSGENEELHKNQDVIQEHEEDNIHCHTPNNKHYSFGYIDGEKEGHKPPSNTQDGYIVGRIVNSENCPDNSVIRGRSVPTQLADSTDNSLIRENSHVHTPIRNSYTDNSVIRKDRQLSTHITDSDNCVDNSVMKKRKMYTRFMDDSPDNGMDNSMIMIKNENFITDSEPENIQLNCKMTRSTNCDNFRQKNDDFNVHENHPRINLDEIMDDDETIIDRNDVEPRKRSSRFSMPWVKKGKLQRNKLTSSMKRRFEIREQRATKRMALIMVCFIVCWLPFLVMYILRSICDSCEVNTHLQAAIIWLGYMNSGLNPILYSLFNEDFKRAFRRLVGLRASRGTG